MRCTDVARKVLGEMDGRCVRRSYDHASVLDGNQRFSHMGGYCILFCNRTRSDSPCCSPKHESSEIATVHQHFW